MRLENKEAKACKYDKKIGKHSYFYRPGSKNLLQRMQMHPRIQVAFYSSIMLKNITPVLTDYTECPELQCIKNDQIVFDQRYCPEMKEHPYMDKIKDEPYDRYRDLNGVWADEVCKDKFMKHNTLLIDSDDKKVQLHLENSITNEPYTFEDVQHLSPLGQDVDAPKRGEEW